MFTETLPWAWSALKGSASELAASAAMKGVTKGSEQVSKKAIELWERFSWDTAESLYRQKLLEMVRTTKILGHPSSIEIDKIYTDVYFFDKLSAIRNYSESVDEDEFDVRGRLEDRQRLEAKSLIERGRNAYILGRPGAGKTTFLKYLAMTSCKGLIERTPIFVSLKDWSDSSASLLDFISRQFDICGFPDAGLFLDAILSSGGALILLDGLDEVNEWRDKRNQVIRDIVNFSSKYDGNQYCLTCRTAATDYSFSAFEYVEVADFTDAQQEQFALQWYGNGSPRFEKFIDAWKQPRNSGLRDLGRTPLLLTLLCLSFDETLSFPRRQVDIYQEALNALLKKWDSSRLITRDEFYQGLSFGQRQQLLETIAASFYFNSRTVFWKAEVADVAKRFVASLPDADSHSDVDGGEVIRQIEAQHGLIVERAKGLYSFSHLTVQEYLTASFLSKTQNQNTLRQVVKSALNDQKWREVMLYTVALLPQGDYVLDEMRRQLVAMKQASTGVLVFLSHCFCTATIAIGAGSRRSGMAESYYLPLRTDIERYVSELRQPSLTPAEITKFFEHIEALNDFLRPRSSKDGYELSAGVVAAAAKFLKQDRLDAGRLLGGYFIKPDQFINFFYACRLFIECLEVTITSRRVELLDEVFVLTGDELKRIEQLVRK